MSSVVWLLDDIYHDSLPTLQVIQRNENKSVPRGPVRFVKLQNQTKFPVMDGYLTLYIDSSISSNLRSYIYILLTVNFVTVSTLGVPKFRVKNQKRHYWCYLKYND